MTAITTVAGGRESPGEDVMGLAALAIADELTGYSLDVRDREGSHVLKVTNVPGLLCEVLITADGSVEWECRPCDSSQANPVGTAGMVRRILGGDAGAKTAEAPAGRFSFKSVVGRLLADCEMAVSVDVHVDQVVFEAYSEIEVTNPAEPGRGRVYVGDDGSVLWQCRIRKQPDDNRALDPREIARIIALALNGPGL